MKKDTAATTLQNVQRIIDQWDRGGTMMGGRLHLADAIAVLRDVAPLVDGYLTAGGNPPTGWTDRLPVRWSPDEEKPEDAPEGFEVVAHMSRVHPGVNVEIDAPDGDAADRARQRRPGGQRRRRHR